MHPFWEKVEHYNSKLILPAIGLLLLVIIYELLTYFEVIYFENHLLELSLEVIDYLIITIFVIDLIFLAIKAKSTKFFFQNYWLDILAVFPFVLASKAIGGIFRIFALAELEVGQAILHESLEVSKVTAEAEKVAKVEKAAKLGRGIKFGARIVRIFSKTVPRFKRKKLKHVRNR